MDKKTFLALPEKQRKAHQERLQAQGLYAGEIDGRFGAGTEAAFAAEAKKQQEEAVSLRASEEKARQDKLRADELEVERIKANTQKATGDTANAEQARKTAARQARADEAGSGLGIATQIGANVGAPAAGAAAGMGMGKLTNAMLDSAQNSRNSVLQGVARDRIASLTTRDAAQQAAKLSGAVPMSNPAARTAARMAPHVGLGLLSIGKGAQTPQQQDPDAPFYADMANRAAGLGYLGAGAGLMKQGLRYGAAPGVAPDAQALAVINSPQLRRGGQSKLAEALSRGESADAEVIPDNPKAALPAPDAPEPKPLNPGTAAWMRERLSKDFQIKGTSKWTKSALAEKLAEQMAEHGSKRTVAKRLPKGTGSAAIPLAVGSYMAATGDSEAADASLGERAGNAAQNFGAGAGAAAAGSKLADVLRSVAPSVMGGLSSGLSAMTPAMIDDMTSGSPEELNMARNTAARTLPELMQFGAVGEARDMAQVPPRSPANSGPRLEDPALQNRIRRMAGSGASPDQIAAFLNGISF